MGLHDRLTKLGDGGSVVLLTPGTHTPVTEVALDPYADLKARIHHQCIAKLGPELYKQAGEDLAELTRWRRGIQPRGLRVRRENDRHSVVQ